MLGTAKKMYEKLGISNQRVQDLDGLQKPDENFSIRRFCRDHPRFTKAFIAICILFALAMVVVIVLMIILFTRPPPPTTQMPTTTIPMTTTKPTTTQVILPEPPSSIRYIVSCRVFDPSVPGCGSFGECYYVKTDEDYTRQCKCHDVSRVNPRRMKLLRLQTYRAVFVRRVILC